MAPAYWKGYLKLSLVTCAVQMAPATTTTGRVGFHNLNRATCNRLRIQLIDEGSREPVADEAVVKGYEVGKDEHVMLTEEDLDSVALDSTHTIEIERFVPRSEIDEVYFDKPYFLAPSDTVAEEPFAVIRDAMAKSGRVGLGRVVLGYRERVVLLEARGKGLVVWRLKFPYEVRDEEAVFERVPDDAPDPKLLATAEQIVDQMKGGFDPKGFADPLREAQLRLIEAKKNQRRPPKIRVGAPAPGPQSERKVTSIFDALKNSLEIERKAKAPRASVAAPRRPKTGKPLRG